jgi:hypothetical protein
MATKKEAAAVAAVLNPMVERFKAARRVSTPLLGVETPDPAATQHAIAMAVPPQTPLMSWDVVRGLSGLNKPGEDAIKKLNLMAEATVNPVITLEAAQRMAPDTVLFMHNVHRQMPETSVMQALWNLRDSFKTNRRMVVLLAPLFSLPDELKGDVIVLSEPLPTRQELRKTILQQHENAGLPVPSDEVLLAALDAVVGLPTFTAEQVTAMALTPAGINVESLWDHKIKAIEHTDGLRVHRGDGSSMDDLRGIENVKDFADKLIAAQAFGAIVFIDEGDKAMAGGMSDYAGDSGVAKDQIGTLLTYIEETQALGVLLVGVAGTGKTDLTKAMAAKSGKPCIFFDLGGMKGGVVGESERKIRAALKVVTATAEGRVLFIMTANNATSFSPELNRRFPDQFFFDVPDAAGRAAIWPVYIKKYGLTPEQAKLPAGHDDGWTGAEIKRACQRAAMFKCSVVEASRFIIPQSQRSAAVLEKQRADADGRFLSASKAGWYEAPKAANTPKAPTVPPMGGGGRSIDFFGVKES